MSAWTRCVPMTNGCQSEDYKVETKSFIDFKFFSQRLKTVTSYQNSLMYHNCYSLLYKKYINTIEMHLSYGNLTVDKALSIIVLFQKEQSKYRQSFWPRQQRVLEQACRDARDVVESMRRFEGVQDMRSVDKFDTFQK